MGYFFYAGVAEVVYAAVLETVLLEVEGSNPSLCTKFYCLVV